MPASRFVVLAVPALAACAVAASPSPAFSTPDQDPLRVAPTPAPGTDPHDIAVDVAIGQPMLLAGGDQTAYVEVNLGGFAIADAERAPVNVALVLDRSGSMAGDKLDKAKEAALLVLDQLRADDTISVISYSTNVDVLIPPTKVGEAGAARKQIKALTAHGSTALYDGVTVGLQQIGAVFDAKKVNRIILLSDGEANVGKSSPAELGELGLEAARQGIPITTIGLGLSYNEDLMSQLAASSDGSHAFAESSQDLSAIFEHELGDMLSVVASDVRISVELGDGVRLVRAIGRDATTTDTMATVGFGQLYAGQSKHVVFEVRIPAGTAGAKLDVADVDVSYTNLIADKAATRHASVAVGFTKDPAVVAAKENKTVAAAAVEAVATATNIQAVALRDAGQIDDARQLLQDNAAYLAREGARLGSTTLNDYGLQNANDSQNLTDEAWQRQRKSMREQQSVNITQRGW
jgi:Ca-activated chloride channel family protein